MGGGDDGGAYYGHKGVDDGGQRHGTGAGGGPRGAGEAARQGADPLADLRALGGGIDGSDL